MRSNGNALLPQGVARAAFWEVFTIRQTGRSLRGKRPLRVAAGLPGGCAGLNQRRCNGAGILPDSGSDMASRQAEQCFLLRQTVGNLSAGGGTGRPPVNRFAGVFPLKQACGRIRSAGKRTAIPDGDAFDSPALPAARLPGALDVIGWGSLFEAFLLKILSGARFRFMPCLMWHRRLGMPF